MKLRLIIAVIFTVAITQTAFNQSLSDLEAKRVLLPNGWSLTPAGRNIPLGDLPLNLVVSHNNKWLAVTNNGQSTQTIELIDRAAGVRADSIIIPKSWYGLAFSSDDKYLYASGGHDNRIYKYTIYNSRLVLSDSLVLGDRWPNRIGTAGIDLEESKHNKLFVVTRDDHSLYVFNLQTKQLESQVTLPAEAYTCKVSNKGDLLYISVWGGKKIMIYDIAENKIKDSIAVGSHPNEMLISKNGKYLFVAVSDDNAVAVIDLKKNAVIETLNAALFPNAPSGSTSNGIALSEDQKTLYIANADNNCLAVYDVSSPGKSRSKGFIPVGWYPTNIKVVGKTIYVTNGKGLSSMANPWGPNPSVRGQIVMRHMGDSMRPAKIQYIAGLFKGSLSMFTEPDAKQLADYSQAVYHNTPYTKEKEKNAGGEAGNPIPMTVGGKSPIKYVFFIVKENRTYDQVLGDVKEGNGDTSLVLFGQKITPNHHKLVNEYVLLDNFYVNAEVSADGHNWSMGAYANDYLEKNWPSNYGQRGGTYGGEGERKIANNRDGFIWDNCKRNNVTYRSYGEFIEKGKARNDALKGHFADYSEFDLSIRDTIRFHQWKKDFDSLLAINAVPQLSTIRFGNDHTEGMRAGKPTPFAHDLGVKYGKDKFFEDDELFDVIEKLTYPEIKQFLLTYVQGGTPIPYERFFGMAGIKYIPKQVSQGFTLGGADIIGTAEGKIVVNDIGGMDAFGKKLAYQKGDELMSLNGETLTLGNANMLVQKYYTTVKEGDIIRIQVNRKNAQGKMETVTLSAPAKKVEKTELHKLIIDPNPTQEQLALRKAWLNR